MDEVCAEHSGMCVRWENIEKNVEKILESVEDLKISRAQTQGENRAAFFKWLGIGVGIGAPLATLLWKVI